jgi:UMP-CMP kinase
MVKGSHLKIFFVLGGPGAGKGIQCARLARKYRLEHLRVCNLLEDERDNPESIYSNIITRYIRKGIFLPKEVIVKLLANAIKRASVASGINTFLLEGRPGSINDGESSVTYMSAGFPQHLGDLELFEKEIQPATMALYFACPEEIQFTRLSHLGLTKETIQERLASFKRSSREVNQKMKKGGKRGRRWIHFDARASHNEMFSAVENALKEWLELRHERSPRSPFDKLPATKPPSHHPQLQTLGRIKQLLWTLMSQMTSKRQGAYSQRHETSAMTPINLKRRLEYRIRNCTDQRGGEGKGGRRKDALRSGCTHQASLSW